MSQTSRNKRFMWRALVVGAVAFTPMMGCEFLGLDGGEEQATEAPSEATPKPKPKPKQAPPPPQQTAVEEYARPDYPNNTRRNPFQPDIEVVQPANLPTEGEERALEPLERFSIGELELVAIISEVAVPKAMFVDPDGFGHVLKEGDRIGRNSGILSDIRDNEVEVTESTGDEGNQTRLRTVKLREAELRVGDASGLSDEERAALEKLLATEEGRQALERQYRDMALGASAVDDGQQQGQQGQAPPRGAFPGIQPPGQRDQEP